MKSSKPILGSAGTIVLLAGLAVGAAGQEASPEPSPAVSPVPLEVEASTESLPVADYWGEWFGHKELFLSRAQWVRDATRRAAAPKARQWFKRAVAVHGDELAWLANHEPQPCYRGEYDEWREAVEDLESIHKDGVRFAGKGNKAGLRQTSRQQTAGMQRLAGLASSVADCFESEPDVADTAPTGNPFIGSWKTVDDFISQDGFHDKSAVKLTIKSNGEFLVRDERSGVCRLFGHGYVPLTLQGTGEFVSEATPEFRWRVTRLHCYPRREGRTSETGDWTRTYRYDPAYDVVHDVEFAYLCYWRAKTGSPKDCKAFWRGTPAPVEQVEAPVEEAASPAEEVTASPGMDEG